MTTDTKVAELLPCPFCGAPAERVDFETGENEGGSCIACTRCQSSGPVEFGYKENFIPNWNRRAALARQEAASSSVAPPALYQHDDGRYALALGDVARHKLTDGHPEWHRVPLDVIETCAAPPAAQADPDEDGHVIDRLAHLLAEISVIVNGPEPAGTKWSYHDLPAKVAALAAAQAVDLKQFRKAVDTYRIYGDGLISEVLAEADRLLALIDQQAGKGVSR